jgi:hypothetical protein
MDCYLFAYLLLYHQFGLNSKKIIKKIEFYWTFYTNKHISISIVIIIGIQQKAKGAGNFGQQLNTAYNLHRLSNASTGICRAYTAYPPRRTIKRPDVAAVNYTAACFRYDILLLFRHYQDKNRWQQSKENTEFC